uniref:SFRICE_027214 n=1 Tax=Spodoptera frugiperda TaxID=7108 RepID=A0A2H1VUP0_SPOFR
MKGIITLLVIVYAVVGRAQLEECLKELEANGDLQVMLKHDDCDKFFLCNSGEPTEMSCPSGLWFNMKTKHCDWPQNVDCEGRNIPGEALEDSDETEYFTTPEWETTPEWTTTTTTEDPEFCDTQTPTTTTSTTTTSTTTTTSSPTVPPIEIPDEFLPNGCPLNPRIHWLLPHQTDCNAFYSCVWGRLVMRNCPPTLHFNRKLQVCDWPWAAGCPATFNKHLTSRQSLR